MSSLIGYNSSSTISPEFSSGTYHHVALSISGTTHTLYLDGNPVAVNSNAGDIYSVYDSAIQDLYIGCAADLSYGYTGIIDDFKIWNRVLSTSEIRFINLNNPFIIQPPSAPTITSFQSINENSVLLYFTQPTTKEITNYYYSINGSAYTACNPIQTTGPLNISGLTNGTFYNFSIYAVNSAGEGGISNIYPDPSGIFVSDTSFNIVTTDITRTLPAGTGIITSVAANDYGTILLSTTTGIYYSDDLGANFTYVSPSGTAIDIACVSINNKGYAVCSSPVNNAVFYSYNCGKTWTKSTFSVANKYPNQVCVTQTGKSYIGFGDRITTPVIYYNYFDIYSSTDLFKSNNTLVFTNTTYPFMFGSEGKGVFNNSYYNGSIIIDNGYQYDFASGISDDAKYMSVLEQGGVHVGTPPYPANVQNVNSFGLFIHNMYVGNNGVTYYTLGTNGPAWVMNLYKYKPGSGGGVTSKGITLDRPYSWSSVNTTASGNYAVAYKNTTLYIFAP
jgi:hypothetical protein